VNVPNAAQIASRLDVLDFILAVEHSLGVTATASLDLARVAAAEGELEGGDPSFRVCRRGKNRKKTRTWGSSYSRLGHVAGYLPLVAEGVSLSVQHARHPVLLLMLVEVVDAAPSPQVFRKRAAAEVQAQYFDGSLGDGLRALVRGLGDGE
jgi:hypothetical protein